MEPNSSKKIKKETTQDFKKEKFLFGCLNNNKTQRTRTPGNTKKAVCFAPIANEKLKLDKIMDDLLFLLIPLMRKKIPQEIKAATTRSVWVVEDCIMTTGNDAKSSAFTNACTFERFNKRLMPMMESMAAMTATH